MFLTSILTTPESPAFPTWLSQLNQIHLAYYMGSSCMCVFHLLSVQSNPGAQAKLMPSLLLSLFPPLHSKTYQISHQVPSLLPPKYFSTLSLLLNPNTTALVQALISFSLDNRCSFLNDVSVSSSVPSEPSFSTQLPEADLKCNLITSISV